MIVDIPKLDSYLKFLHDEAGTLRRNYPSVSWAQGKAIMFDGIAEVLRELRQERQMTTVGGKRIEG